MIVCISLFCVDFHVSYCAGGQSWYEVHFSGLRESLFLSGAPQRVSTLKSVRGGGNSPLTRTIVCLFVCLFVGLFVGMKPEKLYSASCANVLKNEERLTVVFGLVSRGTETAAATFHSCSWVRKSNPSRLVDGFDTICAKIESFEISRRLRDYLCKNQRYTTLF